MLHIAMRLRPSGVSTVISHTVPHAPWFCERVAERGTDMKFFQVLANRFVAAMQRVFGVP